MICVQLCPRQSKFYNDFQSYFSGNEERQLLRMRRVQSDPSSFVGVEEEVEPDEEQNEEEVRGVDDVFCSCRYVLNNFAGCWK